MRGRVNEASNDNLAREESGETRKTGIEGESGSLFRLCTRFFSPFSAQFQPLAQDGAGKEYVSVVGVKIRLSSRYFTLNADASRRNGRSVSLFLPPSLSFRKLLPEGKGATRSRRKRNACNEEEKKEGRKASREVRARREER